jgi:hypothetical protein
LLLCLWDYIGPSFQAVKYEHVCLLCVSESVILPLLILGMFANMHAFSLSLTIFYFMSQVGKKVERATRSPSSPPGLFFQHAGHRFESAFFTPLTYPGKDSPAI